MHLESGHEQKIADISKLADKLTEPPDHMYFNNR
jgi:hypothetical protein